MDRSRAAAACLAVIESLIALAGCVLVSLVIGAVLTLVFVPPTFEAELTLEPRRSGPASLERVARELERAGTVGGVEMIDGAEGRRLLLTGLPTAELPHDLLGGALFDAGYRIGDLSIRPALDLQSVIEKIGAPYLTLQALVFLLAGGLLARFRLARPPEPPRARPLGSIGLGVLAGLGAFAVSLLVAAVLELFGVPVREQEWVRELLGDRAGLLRLVPWIVLIVPVSEEVFFRGYMFRWLAERAGAPLGFALSSVAFAALHGNPSGFPVYVGVGLIFAWVCRRTGSLLAPVAGHVAYNSIVLALALQAPPPV